MMKSWRRVAAIASAALLAWSASPAAAAGARGGYPVVMKPAPGLPAHTLYLPSVPAGLHRKLPVLVWGEGGCAAVGNRYRYFLSEIASHGYVVIAVGAIGPASVESAARGWPKEPVLPAGGFDIHAPAPSYPRDLAQAIDWAVAQNDASGSPLRGRIDTARIAVAGHSCGGLQALAISSTDPRIRTTLMVDSGVWTMGPGGLPGAPDVTKQSLATLHGSIFYLNGERDVALPNAKDDFERIDKAPALLAWRKNVAHSGTFWLPRGGAWATVATAWLDWQLKGDATAARWFSGPDCRLCTDPNWTVRRKNIP